MVPWFVRKGTGEKYDGCPGFQKCSRTDNCEPALFILGERQVERVGPDCRHNPFVTGGATVASAQPTVRKLKFTY